MASAWAPRCSISTWQCSTEGGRAQAPPTLDLQCLSDGSKPLVQVINDHLGVIHPGGLAIFFDAQARYFDLAALLKQGLAVLRVVLRILQRHRHIQTVQRTTGLHAERAGVELIQRQVLGGGVDLGLLLGRALLFAWAGQEVARDDDVAEAHSKCFDEHG